MSDKIAPHKHVGQKNEYTIFEKKTKWFSYDTEYILFDSSDTKRATFYYESDAEAFVKMLERRKEDRGW